MQLRVFSLAEYMRITRGFLMGAWTPWNCPSYRWVNFCKNEAFHRDTNPLFSPDIDAVEVELELCAFPRRSPCSYWPNVKTEMPRQRMISYRPGKNARNGERGITMILVAIAMLSMLAMVALAIDVITLYSARTQAQNAADAAALTAAQMLVNSGVTADPGNSALQATAQTAATKAAQDVAGKMAIAGIPSARAIPTSSTSGMIE